LCFFGVGCVHYHAYFACDAGYGYSGSSCVLIPKKKGGSGFKPEMMVQTLAILAMQRKKRKHISVVV
jgi:hypothetical protein